MPFDSLSAGVNGTIRCMATDSNNNIYVGGSFNTAGSVSANNIAMWNGTTWNYLGTDANNNGTNDVVNAIAIDSYNNVYVGGNFQSVNTGPSHTILTYGFAMWNGAWNIYGQLTSSIEVITTRGPRYTTYYYSSFGIRRKNSYAYLSYQTTNLTAGGTVNAIEIDSNNAVYVGGNFVGASVSGTLVNSTSIIVLQNGIWSAFNPGNNEISNNPCTFIAIDSHNVVYFALRDSNNATNIYYVANVLTPYGYYAYNFLANISSLSCMKFAGDCLYFCQNNVLYFGVPQRRQVAAFTTFQSVTITSVSNIYALLVDSTKTNIFLGGASSTGPYIRKYNISTGSITNININNTNNTASIYAISSNSLNNVYFGGNIVNYIGEIMLYSITYNSNGATFGNVPTDNYSYTPGNQITIAGNPGILKKTGFWFDHWNTNPNGNGTKYYPGGTLTINANTVLYAIWSLNLYLGLITSKNNSDMGVATLVSGTITVNTLSNLENSLIYLSYNTIHGTPGILNYSIITGASFSINSTSENDESSVNWLIFFVN